MAVRNYADIGTNAILIVNRLIANDDLCRLLYYTDADPLANNAQHPITDAIRKKVRAEYIKILPRVTDDEIANARVVLKFDSFLPNAGNKEFKDVAINIEVFVPLKQWIIKNTNLRPFLIMGEIEKSLKDKTVNGLGRFNSLGANLNYLTDDFSVYEMSFKLTSYD